MTVEGFPSSPVKLTLPGGMGTITVLWEKDASAEGAR